MKALVYEEFNSPILLKTVPDPQLVSKSVIIQIKAASICKSDISAWRGEDSCVSLPNIPGHEFSGTVVSVSKDTKIKCGTRAIIPITCGCSVCKLCLSGNSHICRKPFQAGFTNNGGFSEYIVIPNADLNLVPLPTQIDFSSGALLSCRFSCAYHAIKKARGVSIGEWALVFGCGVLGLSSIIIAKSLGMNVIAIDPDRFKLIKAKTLGANEVFHSDDPMLDEAVDVLTKGEVSLSLETSGSFEAIAKSIFLLSEKGKHVQIGFVPKDTLNLSSNLISQIIARELEVIGSHGISREEYEDIFAFIDNNNINLSDLIAKRISLNEAPHYFYNYDNQPMCGAIMV